MGQKMHGVAELLVHARQDTRPSIPFCNVVVESSPPSGGNTRGDVCAPDVRIDREHLSPLLFAGVIVESGGLGWEDRIVVHNTERVGAQRKVAFCSDDGSDGIANPFVRPLRELQCIEGLDWEGETMNPMPIRREKIKYGVKRQRREGTTHRLGSQEEQSRP